MGPRAVHQVLVTLHQGDAMGNEAFAIRGLLRRAGVRSEIFAEKTDPALRGEARPLARYAEESKGGAVCLFHFSPGGSAGEWVASLPGPLVVVYHNLTPAHFFEAWDRRMADLATAGRQLLQRLAPRAALAIAKSEFSRRELQLAGYARTAVVPIVMDWRAYETRPSPVVRRLFRDGRRNVLFVGRIVPNKRFEDLVRSFAAFHREIEPRSRLLLVGSTQGQERYLGHLLQLTRRHGIERDVVFTGHVPHDDLLAYYSVADVFLCLSEHEGYGVPLLEAMHAGVPVAAYAAAAVPETLRGGGVLLGDKRPDLVAGLLGCLIDDAALRSAVLEVQQAVIRRLRETDLGALFLERLAPVLG